MLKKKKGLLVILLAALVVGNTMTVSAAAPSQTERVMYLTNNQTGETCEVLAKETTTVKQTGNRYTVTKVAELYIPEDSSAIVPYTSITDAGATTRIHLNVDYTQSGKRYRLNGVSGRFEQLDTAFTISGRHVMYTCQSNIVDGHVWNKYPTSNSFSYSRCDHWVDTGANIEWWIGAYAECTISRGGSSWTLKATEDVIRNV